MSSLHTRSDIWVTRLKRWTRNEDVITAAGDSTSVVDTDLILHYLNEGKQIIEGEIGKVYPNHNAKFYTETISSRLLEFPIPEEALNDNKIIRVDYSLTDDNKKYYKLLSRHMDSFKYSEGAPEFYYLTKGNMVAEPCPSSGYYRFLVQARDDRLDVRRGSVELAPEVSGGEMVSITLLDTDGLLTTENVEALEAAEYVCVCDFEGNVVAYNIPVASYDESNDKLIMRAGYEYSSGISIGDYVTIGRRTSTHSKLPAETEKYYVEWAKLRILNHDSNTDVIIESPLLQALQESIISSLADIDDPTEIPIDGHLTGNW